jgi:5-methylcytosine-specific restriction endonuclease McrA
MGMNDLEKNKLEELLGFPIKDYPDLFDFETPSKIKRTQTASLLEVIKYRGTDSCMIAYEGSWVNTRGNTCSCSGKAEVVDHLIPISSNRVRKELGVKPLPGKKVESQEIGSAHISNLILACAACNSRKLQSFDRDTIHRVIGLSP